MVDLRSCKPENGVRIADEAQNKYQLYMQQEVFVSLNPILQDLIKYTAENFTQAPGDDEKWYIKTPGFAGHGIVAYKKEAPYTHKEVVESWVQERGQEVIDKIKNG